MLYTSAVVRKATSSSQHVPQVRSDHVTCQQSASAQPLTLESERSAALRALGLTTALLATRPSRQQKAHGQPRIGQQQLAAWRRGGFRRWESHWKIGNGHYNVRGRGNCTVHNPVADMHVEIRVPKFVCEQDELTFRTIEHGASLVQWETASRKQCHARAFHAKLKCAPLR